MRREPCAPALEVHSCFFPQYRPMNFENRSYTKVLESGYNFLLFTASSIAPLVQISLGGPPDADAFSSDWSLRGIALPCLQALHLERLTSIIRTRGPDEALGWEKRGNVSRIPSSFKAGEQVQDGRSNLITSSVCDDFSIFVSLLAAILGWMKLIARSHFQSSQPNYD